MKSMACILIAILLSGCNRNPLSSSHTSEFFPLAVGSTWEYKDTGSDTLRISMVRTVTQSVEKRGKKYTEIQTIYPPDKAMHFKYYRIENDRLYFFSHSSNTEHLFVDFSMNMDESNISRQDDFTYQVTVRERTDDEVVFYFDDPQAEDEKHILKFQQGIGLTSEEYMAWEFAHILHNYHISEEMSCIR